MIRASEAVQVGDKIVLGDLDNYTKAEEVRRKSRRIGKPSYEVRVRAGNLMVLHEIGATPNGPHATGF